MNPKLAKVAAKIAVGLGASLVVGFTIRQERAISEKIDQRFDTSEDEQTEETQP